MSIRLTLLVLVLAAALGSGCGGAAERGRQLYAARGCVACHGANGRGDGPSARRLDAPPRDLSDARSYRQGSSESEIAASIRGGVGAMPAFRDLTESESGDIAAWIVSLRRPPGNAGGQP